MHLENGHNQRKLASETMSHSWFAPPKSGAPLQICLQGKFTDPLENFLCNVVHNWTSLKTGAVIAAAF